MSLREEDLQAALITWRDTLIPKIPEIEWLFHCPNGGKRDGREAQNLKRQGVTAGVVDLHLDVARGGYHGLKIELKIPGGKCKPASSEQLRYIAFCEAQGYKCLVSNDFAECKAFILDYLNGELIRGANS